MFSLTSLVNPDSFRSAASREALRRIDPTLLPESFQPLGTENSKEEGGSEWRIKSQEKHVKGKEKLVEKLKQKDREIEGLRAELEKYKLNYKIANTILDSPFQYSHNG